MHIRPQAQVFTRRWRLGNHGDSVAVPAAPFDAIDGNLPLQSGGPTSTNRVSLKSEAGPGFAPRPSSTPRWRDLEPRISSSPCPFLPGLNLVPNRKNHFANGRSRVNCTSCPLAVVLSAGRERHGTSLRSPLEPLLQMVRASCSRPSLDTEVRVRRPLSLVPSALGRRPSDSSSWHGSEYILYLIP